MKKFRSELTRRQAVRIKKEHFTQNAFGIGDLQRIELKFRQRFQFVSCLNLFPCF